MSDMPVHERISHRIMLYIASNGLRINQFSLEDIIKEELKPLEAQLQEADTTATAIGLALTEARMENERLREALVGSDAALEDAYLEGAASQYMGEKGDADEFNKSKMAWKAKRDELLKKEGA